MLIVIIIIVIVKNISTVVDTCYLLLGDTHHDQILTVFVTMTIEYILQQRECVQTENIEIIQN